MYIINKKKKLGQYFLQNNVLINKLIQYINPQYHENILEIGYGHGEITNNIISYIQNITTLELDSKLVKKYWYSPNPKITLLNINILKFNLYKLYFYKKKKVRIIGNIPYHISNKILFWCIKYFLIIQDITIMVQKEFANTITASNNHPKYTYKSILIQSLYKINKLLTVNKYFFKPTPKINSSFIHLIPRKKYSLWKNLKQFKLFLYNSFKHRRKTIYNNWKNIINNNIYNKLKINPNLRPENISVKQYLQYYKFIKQKKYFLI